jgi:hypothetical protein
MAALILPLISNKKGGVLRPHPTFQQMQRFWMDRRQTLPWDYFRVARHPRRTPEIPAQQLLFLEKRALQLFHSGDVSCHGHLVMTSELRGWGKLGITLRDEFLAPPRYYK